MHQRAVDGSPNGICVEHHVEIVVTKGSEVVEKQAFRYDSQQALRNRVEALFRSPELRASVFRAIDNNLIRRDTWDVFPRTN